jgi:hypothetical protein
MIETLRQYTRTRRARLFREFIERIPGRLRIVDLGGTISYWNEWGLTADDRFHVTLINNHDANKTQLHERTTLPNLDNVLRDACDVTADDYRQYDVIFSNSFIEHLTSREKQVGVARRIIDSGRPYFIQTPNKYSLVDPHFPRPYVPFFAAYPRAVQARLLTFGALGSGSSSPSFEAAMARLQYYHPLSREDVRELFPDARIVVERPMGVPMSIVAMDASIRRSPGSVRRRTSVPAARERQGISAAS